MRLKYFDVASAITIGVLAVFLYYNHFDTEAYNKYYYVSFKFWELILFYGLGKNERGKRRTVWYAISFFLLARVVWEIFNMENTVEANQPYWIDGLFALLIVCILFTALINHSKKWRN